MAAPAIIEAIDAIRTYVSDLEARVRELEGEVRERDHAIDDMCDEIHELKQRVGAEVAL